MIALIVGMAALIVAPEHPGLERADGLLRFDDAPFSGSVEAHSPGGARIRSTPYLRGARHGRERLWYDDGALRAERHYSRGKKSGRHRGFWSDGRPQFDVAFKDGEQHGLYRAWHENGGLSQIRHFVLGKEHGSQKSWTESGELFANYVVRDGRRYGLIGSQLCFTVSGAGS